MKIIHFYEKPGCVNNTKQKKLLQASGHQVIAHNLLTYAWTEAKLLSFFNNMPTETCFNKTAPAIKNGEINPQTLDKSQAITLMLDNPILIRRPLMEIADIKLVGFDVAVLRKYINVIEPKAQDMETCVQVKNR